MKYPSERSSIFVRLVCISLFFFLFSTVSFAQLKHPKVSPEASVIQQLGFTEISVNYSRPAVRGRKIFGDLVPYGRIWRVGANAATTITIDTPFKVDGQKLAAGTYALYAFPEKDSWTIVFHTNVGHWGDGRKAYKTEEDALRFQVVPKSSAVFQENFLIYFDHITHDRLEMIWLWANTRVVIPISVATHVLMQQQIKKALSNAPTAQTYYEVARYYVEQEIKYAKALAFVNKAIAAQGDTYYFYRVKSLAEAALGVYDAAIASAEKSLQLAQKLDKDEFVRMNQKNIDLWSKTMLQKGNK